MLTTTTAADEPEGEYAFYHLLCDYFAGLVLIDAVLAHAEFQRRLKRYSFIHARKKEDADDLCQEASLRVFLYQHTLSPENTPNERAFFGWLFVLTRNAFLSGLRSRGVPIDDQLIEDIQVADGGPSPEDECYRREFVEFSKSLPDSHRLAVEYFLESYSFREIMRLLNAAGIRCSHVTVRTWVRDAQSAFETRKQSSVRKAVGF